MNKAAGLTDDLKKVIVTKLIEQVMAWLAKQAPWVAWPVINPIVQMVVGEFVSYLVDRTVVGLTVLWVIVDLQFELADVEKATARLKDMLDNPEKYTEDQVNEISKQFDDRAIELIHLVVHRV